MLSLQIGNCQRCYATAKFRFYPMIGARNAGSNHDQCLTCNQGVVLKLGRWHGTEIRVTGVDSHPWPLVVIFGIVQSSPVRKVILGSTRLLYFTSKRATQDPQSMIFLWGTILPLIQFLLECSGILRLLRRPEHASVQVFRFSIFWRAGPTAPYIVSNDIGADNVRGFPWK